jgi:predicted transcriptional regulator
MNETGTVTSMAAETDEIRRLTVQIVSPHIANSVVPNDLPALIAQVFDSLEKLEDGGPSRAGPAAAGGFDQEIGDAGVSRLP